MRPSKYQIEVLKAVVERAEGIHPNALKNYHFVGRHSRLYMMFEPTILDALIEGGLLETSTDHFLDGVMTVHLTEKGREHLYE